jgi:anti-anti-sigma factor
LPGRQRSAEDVVVTLQIDVVHSDSGLGVVVADVTVVGEIDMATSDQLTHAVETALANRPTIVRLDLAATSFIDSSGLRAVVAAEHRTADDGARLAIVGMSAAVEKILEITGLIERYRDADPSAP